jgi:hypothetical protein
VSSWEAGDDDLLIEGDVADGTFVMVHGYNGTAHAVTSCGMDRALRSYRKLLAREAPIGEFAAQEAVQAGSAG